MEKGIFEGSSSSAAARARTRAAFSSFRSETREACLNGRCRDYVRRRSLTGMSRGIDALDYGRWVIPWETCETPPQGAEHHTARARSARRDQAFTAPMLRPSDYEIVSVGIAVHRDSPLPIARCKKTSWWRSARWAVPPATHTFRSDHSAGDPRCYPSPIRSESNGTASLDSICPHLRPYCV